MNASASNPDLMTAMPLLARNEGDWYGTYIIIDEDGAVLDRHRSHIIVRFTPGADRYEQTNIYTWPDGTRNQYSFTGVYENGAVIYDTERISGRAYEADAHTLILRFHYKADPDKYLYEYIHLSDDGQHRTRIWHWFDERGVCYRRTLVNETRTPPDEGPS